MHGYVPSPSTAMGPRARRRLKSSEPEGFEFWNQERWGGIGSLHINKQLGGKTFQRHTKAQETHEEAEPRSRQDILNWMKPQLFRR